MGLSMPKFLTNSYSSIKERCNEVREGWKMIKTVYTLSKSLEGKSDPDDFINTIKTSDALPESYKSFMSSIDSETLRKMTKTMMDTVQKRRDKPISSELSSEVAEIMAETVGSPFQESNGQETSKETVEATVKETSQTDNIEENLKELNNTVNKEPSGMSDELPEENITFIPSDTYKNIMETELHGPGTKKKTPRQPSDAPKQPFEDTFTSSRDTSDPPQPNKENQHPMKKMLAEQLRQKFGDNWRQKVPPSLFNPETMTNVPDLGLGLDKQSNRTRSMDGCLNPYARKDFVPTFYFKPVNTDYKTNIKERKHLKCYLEQKITPSLNQRQLVENPATKHNAKSLFFNLEYFKNRDVILDQLSVELEKNDQDINLLKDQYQHLKRENRRLRLLLYYNSFNSDLKTKPDGLVEVSTDQQCQQPRVPKQSHINTLKQSNRDFSFYEETRRFKRGLTLFAERIQLYKLDLTENGTLERRITTGECPQNKLTYMNNGHINNELISEHNNHPLPTEKLTSARATNSSEICTKCGKYNQPRLIVNRKELKNGRDTLQDFQSFYDTPEQYVINSSKPNYLPPHGKRQLNYQLEKINTDHKCRRKILSQSSVGRWETGNMPKLECFKSQKILETLSSEPNQSSCRQNSKVVDTNTTTVTDIMCSGGSYCLDKENSSQSLDRLKPKIFLPVNLSEFKNDINLRALRNAQLPDKYRVKLGYHKNNEICSQRFRFHTPEKIRTPRSSKNTPSYQSASRGRLDGRLTDLSVTNSNNSNLDCKETPSIGARYLKTHQTVKEKDSTLNHINSKRRVSGYVGLGGINRLNTPDKSQLSLTYSVRPFRKNLDKDIESIRQCGEEKNEAAKQEGGVYGIGKVDQPVDDLSPLKIPSNYRSRSNLPNRYPAITIGTIKGESQFYKYSQIKSMPSESNLLLAKPNVTKRRDISPSIANSDLKYPETEGCCIM